MTNETYGPKIVFQATSKETWQLACLRRRRCVFWEKTPSWWIPERRKHIFVPSDGKSHRLMTVLGFVLDPEDQLENHVVSSVCGRLSRVLHLLRKLKCLTISGSGYPEGQSARIMAGIEYGVIVTPLHSPKYAERDKSVLWQRKPNWKSIDVYSTKQEMHSLGLRGYLSIQRWRLLMTQESFPLPALKFYNKLTHDVRVLSLKRFEFHNGRRRKINPFYSLEESYRHDLSGIWVSTTIFHFRFCVYECTFDVL